VLDATQLHKVPLSQLDVPTISKLLTAMRAVARRVKPAALGLIGEAHLYDQFTDAGCDMETFEYRKVVFDDGDIPTVVEAAFAANRDECYAVSPLTGTKWSPAIRSPFRTLGPHGSLDGLLSDLYADEGEPVTVFVHVAQPLSSFTDRGKSAVVVPPATADAIVEAVTRVTKRWTKQRKKEVRDANARASRAKAVARSRSTLISQKAAAEIVMKDAYMKASANGTLPAHARQIMYAARPRIQELSGKDLGDVYFTQTLLPDYIAKHGCDWNVAYDARGHFHEPHTNHEVPLGTLDVADYLKQLYRHVVEDPHYDVREYFYPTLGPKHRYSAILFIEKEGFMPLFEAVNLKERFDIAIMSTKGMSVVASRVLSDELDIPLFAVHDFDKAGFSIVGALKRDSRRHTFANDIRVIDLGLRLDDVEGLEIEASRLNPDEHDAARLNLAENGATPDEIEFMLHHRVELNAFTSDGLVAWLERKLNEHGIQKVIPDDETLAAAYQRARESADVQLIIDEAIRRRRARPSQIIIPADLRARVEKALNEDRGRPWDEVVAEMARQADGASSR
jgi:hypothetical protein